jgi:hypothetical protein
MGKAARVINRLETLHPNGISEGTCKKVEGRTTMQVGKDIYNLPPLV